MPVRANIDSDILIAYVRKERSAQEFLRRQSSQGMDLWTGAMQRAEILFFMRPGEEPDTLHFMSKFRTASVTQKIVDDGGVLFRAWNRSHGTGLLTPYWLPRDVNWWPVVHEKPETLPNAWCCRFQGVVRVPCLLCYA